MRKSGARRSLQLVSVMTLTNVLSSGVYADGYRFEGLPTGWRGNGTQAAGMLNTRCVEDQITENAQAVARIDWADRCRYVSKTKWHMQYNYNVDPVTMATTPRVKKAYPIFVHNNAAKDLWQPTDLTKCNMPANVEFYTICQAGCYAKGQRIWSELDGGRERLEVDVLADVWQQNLDFEVYPPQLDVENAPKVMALTRGSTMETLSYAPIHIRSAVASFKAADTELVTLTTASGGSIKVTLDHPLLRKDGRMVEAHTLKVGDSLVREDGTFDPIVSSVVGTEFTRVYNIAHSSDEPLEQVHVAEGFLSGSLSLQNGNLTLERILSDLKRNDTGHVSFK